MPISSSEAPVSWPAYQAISALVLRYCRAVDRCDVDLLKSVYWDDGTDGHGIFDGNAHEFADMIIPFLQRTCSSTMHQISNLTLVQEGTIARGETYVVAHHFLNSALEIGAFLCDPAASEAFARKVSLETRQGPFDLIVGGRYLDDFEQRGGQWRIRRRTLVVDWCQTAPSTMFYHAGNSPEVALGKRDRTDLSYRLLERGLL